MADCSIVALRNLENFQDFSPEYYRPAFLALAQRLRKWPTARIGKLAYITDGEHGSPQWDPNSGIRYVSADFIKPNYIEDATMRFISASQALRNQRCTLQENDVLVYSVGAYAGYAARAEPHLFPASIPRSVAIIRPWQDSGIDSGFLSIFLNSKFGSFQSKRLRAGNSQPVLALDKIRQYEFPLIPLELQSPIGEMYEKAYRLRLTAKNYYAEAFQCIESQLGLAKTTFRKPVGFTTHFSSLETSRRFDSEHFYPAFAHFVSSLKRTVKLTQLAGHLSFCQRGKQPLYGERGLPVINSKHVQTNRVIISGNRKSSPSVNLDMEIRLGDLLINGTGRGTIGRAAPYLEKGNALPDNHVTILRTKELDPIYLSYYLNSAAGQMQVEMHQRGSSGQLELYPFDLRKFLVWEAPRALQMEIRRLHEQAASAERESKRLLEEAKARVEQLIEEAVKS